MAEEKKRERIVEYYRGGKIYEANPFADFFASPTDVIKRGDKVENVRERNILGEEPGLVMTVDRITPIVTLKVYEGDEENIGVMEVYGVPAKAFAIEKEQIERLKEKGVDTDLLFGEELKLNKVEKEIKGKEPVAVRTIYALIGGHDVRNGRRVYKHIGETVDLPGAASYYKDLTPEKKELIKALSRIINAGEKTFQNEEYLSKIEEGIGKIAETDKELAEQVSAIYEKAKKGGEELKEAQKEAMSMLLKTQGEILSKMIKKTHTVDVEVEDDEFVKIRESRSGIKLDIDPDLLLGSEVTFVTIPEISKDNTLTGYERVVSIKKDGKELLGEENNLYYTGTKQLWDSLALAKAITIMKKKDTGLKDKEGREVNFEYGKQRLQALVEELENAKVGKMYSNAYEKLAEIAKKFLEADSPKEVNALLYEVEEEIRKLTVYGQFINKVYRARDFLNNVREGKIERAQYLDFMDRLGRKLELYGETKAIEPEIKVAQKETQEQKRTQVIDLTKETPQEQTQKQVQEQAQEQKQEKKQEKKQTEKQKKKQEKKQTEKQEKKQEQKQTEKQKKKQSKKQSKKGPKP